MLDSAVHSASCTRLMYICTCQLAQISLSSDIAKSQDSRAPAAPVLSSDYCLGTEN